MGSNGVGRSGVGRNGVGRNGVGRNGVGEERSGEERSGEERSGEERSGEERSVCVFNLSHKLSLASLMEGLILLGHKIYSPCSCGLVGVFVAV